MLFDSPKWISLGTVPDSITDPYPEWMRIYLSQVDPHPDWVQAGQNVPLRKENQELMFEDLLLNFFQRKLLVFL